MSKQPEFFDSVSEIETILDSRKIRKINKFFRIDNISNISKLFFYLALPGVILVILSIFFFGTWLFAWIYALVIIILMGFIFTKSDKRYNFFLVLGILAVLAFIITPFGQSSLNILGFEDTDSDLTTSELGELKEILTPLKAHLNERYTLDDVIDAMRSGAKRIDFTDYETGKYSYLFKDSAWPNIDPHSYKKVFYPNLTKALESALAYIKENEFSEPGDISAFTDALSNLAENPLADLPKYITNFIDIINWIVFLFMIGYGASGIGDFLSGRWDRIAIKAALIAMAIAIMTFIYSLFGLIDIKVRTVWDTIGSAWNSMLKGIGLAQLDQAGNIRNANIKTIVNGLFSWIPLIITLVLFGLAFAFRYSDFKSLLFSRNVLKDNRINVEPSKFSIPIAIILFVMGIYVVGYFLITAEPTLTINPIITLAFYLFSIVVLFLIGFKVLILNKEFTIKSFSIDLAKWTILGLFFLYLWFQVFQPIMYDLNLIDTPSGLLTLSQESVFRNNILEQLFLVAAPETLIFQIFPIGIGNRVYFYFRRTRIWKKEQKRLNLKAWNIAIQYKNIKINPNSISRENLRKIAKLTVLKQKHDEITESLKRSKIQRVPFRFFIIPTIIAGLIGSFFFSWYHSFRRGIGFITWWQNPMLGMVYFGAGFFLCFIAFFNIIAAILVHAFNNIIALLLSGA